MVKDSINGKMVDYIRENLFKIKDMGLELMNGKMVENMKDYGIMVSSMVKVTIMNQMVK